MTSATTIVFVPGFYSVASIVYRPLLDILRPNNSSRTIELVTVELPSITKDVENAKFVPDALTFDTNAVRDVLKRLIAEEKRSVIVVAHSYGGTPALYACEGFWAEQGSGVKRAILLSSSLCLPGETVAGVRAQYASEHGGIDDSKATIVVHGDNIFAMPDDTARESFFNDVEDPEVRESLLPVCIGGAMTPTPNAEISSWRITYVVTAEKDLCMPQGFQESLISKAQSAGAQIKQLNIASGHFLQVSHAVEVAQIIIDDVATVC